MFPVHFRQQDVDLWKIGFMSLLGLAWTLKFIWAPAVDYYRHHRRWIFSMDVMMGFILLIFAVKVQYGPWVWMAIGLFTLFSATSDIAIDGFTIEFLKKEELGIANGLRIAFYRVGMLGAGFILILSDMVSWSATYLGGAAILVLFGTFCLFAPREKDYGKPPAHSFQLEMLNLARQPGGLVVVYLFLLGGLGLVDLQAEFSAGRPYFWPAFLLVTVLVYLGGKIFSAVKPGEKTSLREELKKGPMFGALFEMLQRPNIIPVIVFILIFKLADTSMGFMVKPFWVDAGFSASEIGMVSVNLGLGLSIAGGLAGGWFTDRFGIFKGLWILGLFQALSNLGYAAVAGVIPTPVEGVPLETKYRMMMYSASIVESFTGGLGTAAFLAFLMAIVNKRKAATEYALLSSIFALSRSLSGWAGGFGAHSMGYASYFTLTFFLAFPAYALLPWVKRMMQYTADNWKEDESNP